MKGPARTCSTDPRVQRAMGAVRPHARLEASAARSPATLGVRSATSVRARTLKIERLRFRAFWVLPPLAGTRETHPAPSHNPARQPAPALSNGSTRQVPRQ